jgi:redox-sensitive bicupin YhaK (pirin superfamily)
LLLPVVAFLHGHRDMEIITYILEGALKHEDSMGTVSFVLAMAMDDSGHWSRHSEQNDSSEQPAHLLQI